MDLRQLLTDTAEKPGKTERVRSSNRATTLIPITLVAGAAYHAVSTADTGEVAWVLAASVCLLLLWRRICGLDTTLSAAQACITHQSVSLEMQSEELLAKNEELEQNSRFQVEATERFEQASRRFQELFQGLPVACFCYDSEGRIFEWNRACEALYGLRAEQVLLRPIWEVVVPAEARERMEGIVTRVFAGESFEGLELEETLPEGGRRFVLCNTFPLRGADDRVIGGISANMDITERKQAEETVHWQAYHDALTHLPNRVLFQDRLSHALTTAERNHQFAAVLFFDLDHFKRINDTLGHAVGDILLQQVARRLGECLRSEDTVARMGGDEFTILLPNITGPNAAVKVAQKVLRTLSVPFLIQSHELHITTSIGVAMYPDDGEDADTLLKNADAALYASKGQGRGTYQLFNESMNASAFEHLVLENSLRKALERDELRLHYQPQIHLATGAVVGVEALVRWNHPDLGLIPPCRFIPLAEETGLIRALGGWALREACRQAALWQRAGAPLRMSVNLSARQFRHCGLMEGVREALEETGLDPQLLDLELTETALMENGELAVETLRDLKTLGVRLSVDDFGTGYSSLSYLRRFPLDVLKVDKAFVQELADDLQDQAVVRAVIELAHALNMEVIAEGVETAGQRDHLHRLGCDAAQGYLFGAPVSAERFEASLLDTGSSFALPHVNATD